MRKPREIDLDQVTRLILVDIRTRSRIGIFGELVGRPGVPIHVYDHHPTRTRTSRATSRSSGASVRPRRSSSRSSRSGGSHHAGRGDGDDAGDLRGHGLARLPSTTVDDYLAAAHLLSRGAKLTQVSDILAKDLTSGQISLLYDLLQGRGRTRSAGSRW